MPTPQETSLLIAGAGPFGLAAAARAQHLGLDHVVLGRPLSFWKNHMPKGMYLRSGYDWHLDPQNVRTFEHFLADQNLERTTPISLDRFLAYGEWFQRECNIRVDERRVTRIERGPGDNRFTAHLDDDSQITAPTVLCAPGFHPFRNLPGDLTRSVPPDRLHHTADIADPAHFADRRCLIIGGRQSAFETGALLMEHGAAAVTIVHRHPSPAFAESDWSFVAGDIQSAQATPGWFANLPTDERRAIERRFWGEGRLKLEPWLGKRLRNLDVTVIQNTSVTAFDTTPDGVIRATLAGERNDTLIVDHVICATGFKVDLACVAYLKRLLPDIETTDGYPNLTPTFESQTLTGLFLVGLCAARQFGPYMGFLASCTFAAQTAVDAAAAQTLPRE
jgi:thioredoxin reductase